MSDLIENQSPSSFMMLTAHLHHLFTRYILNGRIRAPPEVELGDMIPTFQRGAKTDRRALQSKFKSWARRMEVENGELKMSATGKLIIPQEKCDHLVMQLHSDSHLAVDKIISKIQQKYTWTRKNFGMDRDIVIQALSNNCQREICHQNLRIEWSSFCRSISESETETTSPGELNRKSFVMPSPLTYIPSYTYSWATPISSRFSYQSTTYHPRFLLNPSKMFRFEGYPDLKIVPQGWNPSPHRSKNEYLSLREDLRKTSPVVRKPEQSIFDVDSNIASSRAVVKFKKPKNMNEYKNLLEGSARNPTEYPLILNNDKAKFLAALNLAPKSLCSRRTLRKFSGELKRKNVLRNHCLSNMERKVLRDRNKLKKSSQEQNKKRHSYLEVTNLKKDYFPRVSTPINKLSKSNKWSYLKSFFSKLGKRESNGQKDPRIMAGSSHNRSEMLPEVVDITSTDEDEIERKNDAQNVPFSQDANQIYRNYAPQTPLSVPQNQSMPNISVAHLKEFSKRPPVYWRQTFPQMKNADISFSNGQNLFRNMQQESRIPQVMKNAYYIKSYQKSNPATQPYLLPTDSAGGLAIIQSSDYPVITSSARPLQSTSIVRTYTRDMNSVFKNLNTHSKPMMKESTGVPRQVTPFHLQSSSNTVTHSNIPPIRNPYESEQSTMDRKIIVVDKIPTGAIVIVPQYPQKILPKGVQMGSNNKPRLAPRPPILESRPRLAPMVLITGDNTSGTLKRSSTTSHKLSSEVTKEKTTEPLKINPNAAKNKEKDMRKKDDIHDEMMKISEWIKKTKNNLGSNMFQKGLEKSMIKLSSQLDIGLSLVREARSRLIEVEHAQNLGDKVSEGVSEKVTLIPNVK